jgi:drug/metabolite transporter (DMT)-like permease
MSYTLGFGGLLVIVVSLPAMVDQDWGQVSMQSWVILAYAIVGPVYLAYALWSWAIRHRGIPRTVVYGFLVPVLGGAIAVVALDERVRPEQVVGGLLVLAGLLVTRLGPAPAADAQRDQHARAARHGVDDGGEADPLTRRHPRTFQ